MRFVASAISACLICLAHVPESVRGDGLEILDEYRRYLLSIGEITFEAQIRDYVAEKSDDFTNELIQEWKLDLVNQRMHRVTRTGDAGQTNNVARPPGTQAESLVTSAKIFEISIDSPSGKAVAISSYMAPPSNYWPGRIGLGYIAYPFGYIKIGQKYVLLRELLNGASSREAGMDVVLNRRTSDYELEVAFNKSKGGMPNRIDYIPLGSNTDQLASGRLFYKVAEDANINGIWIPVRYACKVETPARVEQMPSGVRVVNGILTVVDDATASGASTTIKPASTLIAEIGLSNISLGSLQESDFQVLATIPDNLPISMQDARHLEYVWLDGEVTPRTDAMSALMGDTRFFGGTNSPRFWLFAATLVTTLVLLWLKMRKWRRFHHDVARS